MGLRRATLTDCVGAPTPSTEDLALLCCPACGAALVRDGDGLGCTAGAHRFALDDGIPLLFWPNEWEVGRADVTERVRAFYEETPFPDYEDFDSVASLAA